MGSFGCFCHGHLLIQFYCKAAETRNLLGRFPKDLVVAHACCGSHCGSRHGTFVICQFWLIRLKVRRYVALLKDFTDGSVSLRVRGRGNYAYNRRYLFMYLGRISRWSLYAWFSSFTPDICRLGSATSTCYPESLERYGMTFICFGLARDELLVEGILSKRLVTWWRT